jgi:hypothetical protein
MLSKDLVRIKLFIMVGVMLLLPSCTFLSNQGHLQQYPQYGGLKRVAVFVQRWPVNQQLPNQNDLGADFIKKSTLFTGPWQPAGSSNPRAVEIQDIDDEVAATLLTQALTEKGYEPFLSGVFPAQPGPITVGEIMAKCQAVDPWVDTFLFCFYSPVVFCAEAQATPAEHRQRSYGLQELIGILNPGATQVIWAGPRAAQAPPRSISHAFIYVSMTMFKALDWRPLWEVADAQVGGRMRVNLNQCPPAPTDQNYPADAAIIQRLMTNNLTCRLQHLIPDAF